MATRAQTIGYALLDSPVALAAWLLDHDTDSYYKISRAFVDGEPHVALAAMRATTHVVGKETQSSAASLTEVAIPGRRRCFWSPAQM